MPPPITVTGARLHNLQNVSLTIPKNRLVVLTGVSGSGKSTLGIDLLHRESQRQFMEALGMVTFGLAKPPVDDIRGLPPSVSVDQHATNRSPRSTVGTSSDVYTYLRVLFARLGHRPCPACGQDVGPAFAESAPEWEGETGADDDAPLAENTLPCPHCGAPLGELDMAHFSFNKPEGACPTCAGIGRVRQVELSRLVDFGRTLAEGAVHGWGPLQIAHHAACLKAAAAHYGFALDLTEPVGDFGAAAHDLLLHGVASPLFRRHFPTTEPPATVRGGRFEGIATNLLRRHAEHVQAHVHQADYEDKLEAVLVTATCPDCAGTRLRAESRAVTVHGQSILALAGRPLGELGAFGDQLDGVLCGDERRIAEPVLAALRAGIARLVDVGLGYLTLDRAAPTLSAGEAQRLRLAALLGSALSGLLYVLDEPTIGLHARDVERLVAVLRRLRDLGNTVLVIEHDLDVIRAADHVIDFGPGAGRLGGQVVAAGTPAELAAHANSVTGPYLGGRCATAAPPRRRAATSRALTVRGARENNLRNLTVRLPLGLLVAVTGVSGSGKSTLVFDIVDRAVRQRLCGGQTPPGAHDAVDGLDAIDQVVTFDQNPIVRVPRSNVATYADVFGAIRDTFAATPAARALGLTPGHFSFNVPGGRCERCQGTGLLSVSMHFLPAVSVRCPTCRGRRFTRQTLAVRYREHDIAAVLELPVADALTLFAEVPAIASRLRVLVDIGLGYLPLGQPAPTLSGGEAQRVKLARELGRTASGHTLYLLDEPTTGLHVADTARLLGALQRLVAAGHSVVVVEHNLDFIQAADWVVDLGPEGGAAGGQLVAEGPPEQVAATPGSHTGRFLRRVL